MYLAHASTALALALQRPLPAGSAAGSTISRAGAADTPIRVAGQPGSGWLEEAEGRERVGYGPMPHGHEGRCAVRLPRQAGP